MTSSFFTTMPDVVDLSSAARRPCSGRVPERFGASRDSSPSSKGKESRSARVDGVRRKLSHLSHQTGRDKPDTDNAADTTGCHQTLV